MIKTVSNFVKACETLDNDGIYALFENQTSVQTKSDIYSHADTGSSEPFRSAMQNLGIDY